MDKEAGAASAQAREPNRLQAKVYGVMAVTTLLTFGTLTTGYQLLLSSQLLA